MLYKAFASHQNMWSTFLDMHELERVQRRMMKQMKAYKEELQELDEDDDDDKEDRFLSVGVQIPSEQNSNSSSNNRVKIYTGLRATVCTGI